MQSKLFNVVIGILAVFFSLSFLCINAVGVESDVILLIASLAVLTLSTALVLAAFGSSTKTIGLSRQNATLDFKFFTITYLQAAIISSAMILFFALLALMKKTRLGKAMQALSDNKDVAQVVGISPERIYTWTFVIGGGLAAI